MKKPINLTSPLTNTKTKSEKKTADIFVGQLAKVNKSHSDIYFNQEHKAEVDQWADAMKYQLTSCNTPGILSMNTAERLQKMTQPRP